MKLKTPRLAAPVSWERKDKVDLIMRPFFVIIIIIKKEDYGDVLRRMLFLHDSSLLGS